jgi:SAM-dependent methyltransferase
MRVRDVSALAHDLKAYRSHWEDPVTRAQLVDGALPRLLATLEMLPEGTPDCRVLELGSAPFFTSIALDREWPGKVTRANYQGTTDTHGSQSLINLEGGPPKVYEYDLFNIEVDEFPYPDGTFDVVLFSELIEHLGLNPVWALSEIHRVLKPGGHVVVTTPNALSLERLETYLTGGSQMVDKYMPLLGYGARHNREYQPAELREVLESTGFDVEVQIVRDLGEHSRRTRLRRAVWKMALRVWSRQPRDTHMFVRARRRDVFRWHFPPRLYDHMQMYYLIRHPWVEMGVNDDIQCGVGWGGLEDWKEWGGSVRRLSGDLLHMLGMPATLFLRGRDDARRVVVRLRAVANGDASDARVEFRVARFKTDERLGERTVQLPAGEWQDVAIDLVRAPVAREELELQIELPPGVEIAAKRVWLD